MNITNIPQFYFKLVLNVLVQIFRYDKDEFMKNLHFVNSITLKSLKTFE